MIVIDASIVVAWYLDPNNLSARAAFDALAESDAVVPGNFHTEVAQVLMRAERQQRLTVDDLLRVTEEIATLPLVVELPMFSAIVTIARRHSLSAYDAAYLALAIDYNAPLATLDQQLAEAAGAERRAFPRAQ